MNVGFALGVAAAVFFASTGILVRIGQRTRPDDDGVFMTVFVNVLVLGTVAALSTWPPWDASAIVAFLIGGLIGTVGGRTALLRGVRLIGPTRSSAFVTGAPIVAAIAGWIALNETLSPFEILGGAIAISGLLVLIQARSASGSDDRGPVPLGHYMIAAAAPLAFGLAFVVRKWGLERFPSSIIGAFLGAAAALVLISMIEAGRGNLQQRVRSNFTDVSWWFVAAGVTASLALLSQFQAFTYLEAWVVGILQGTQAIWTVALSAIILRGDERIDARLIGAILLVVAGASLIALQG